MPRIPYEGVPQVAAEARAAPEISGNAPAAAFGAGLGAATSHLGQTLERSGDELFQRALALQQLHNQTEASEANVNFMIEAGKLHAEYNSLQGAARVAAYDDYAKNLQQLQQKIGGRLSNAMSRRMYDVESRGTMARTIFSGAAAAGEAQKQWAMGTAKAQIDIDAKAGGDDPNDEVGFQERLNRARDRTTELAQLSGAEKGDAIEQDMQLNTRSKMWTQRIIGLSYREPWKAGKMLDEASKNHYLVDTDRNKLEAIVRASQRAIGSVNIANDVYSAGRESDTAPGKTLAQMEDEARAKAKALSPDDPILAQHAVSALQGLYNQDKRAQAQEKFSNSQIVAEGIQKGVKNEQELRSDPKIAAAIDALPEAEQLKIPGQINAYNAARDKPVNEDNFRRLLGQAQSDPEEFVNTDIMAEKLNQAQMQNLRKLQQKMKENPGGDPRVQSALNQIRGARGAELEALGIMNRSENKDDYDKFVGALQQALDVWHDTHGKRPGYKDIVDTIAPDVMKQIASPGAIWGNLWPNKTPRYLREPPDDWVTAIQDARAKAGQDPATAQQLQQAYAREQFQKLYAKPKTETNRVPQSQ